jgi:hypothetical protein
VQYKQQANPLLSLHYYTPLVISSNDSNKQLTLLKPMQTRIYLKKYHMSMALYIWRDI